jgi:hexokinase
MEKSQEFLKREFIQLLSDTLALLGAEKRLIEEIKASEENPFSLKMIEKIRKYNREQKDKTRDAAALLNTTFSYPSN